MLKEEWKLLTQCYRDQDQNEFLDEWDLVSKMSGGWGVARRSSSRPSVSALTKVAPVPYVPSPYVQGEEKDKTSGLEIDTHIIRQKLSAYHVPCTLHTSPI